MTHEPEEGALPPELAARLGALPSEVTVRPALSDRVAAVVSAARPARRRASPARSWMQMAALVLLSVAGTLLVTRGVGRTGGADVAGGQEWLLLLVEDPRYDAPRDSVAMAARVAEYGAWAGDLAQAGLLVRANELGPERSVLQQGEPYVREMVAPSSGEVTGYFIVTAPSRDSAERIARGSPHWKYGGVVVVRSVVP